MDTFPDLGALTDRQLKETIEEHTRHEHEVSHRRSVLHGRIDLLRAELVGRLRKKHEEGRPVITEADVAQLTDILASGGTSPSVPAAEAGGHPGAGGVDLEDSPRDADSDSFQALGALTDYELKEKIEELRREEGEVSYRRRILHGRIDLLRWELVSRLSKGRDGEPVISGADVQQLADILAGKGPPVVDVPGEAEGPPADPTGPEGHDPGGGGRA